MRPIRVLIVDDSALVRQILKRTLSEDERLDVVATARNGVEAIERARELCPDVVTLDIEMPEMTGLEALPHILRQCDARIVMLSSVQGEEVVFTALELGAIAFVSKPGIGMASAIDEFRSILVDRIVEAFEVDPVDAMESRRRLSAQSPERCANDEFESSVNDFEEPLVCVGFAASTGGPPVVERTILALSEHLPAAYLITQHLPQGFSASFARRLNRHARVRVIEASDGLEVEAGCAYVAPYGRHLGIARYGGTVRLSLVDREPMRGVRPAADVMFEHIADVFGPHSIGVVLSGMGADGAAGAARIHEAGGWVITQDEPTSVVWGMPGAVVAAGIADVVVASELVATEIRRAVMRDISGVRAHG